MRTRLRRLVESVRRLSGAGAVLNARLEVDRSTASIVDLDRQLYRVSSPPPRAA